MMMKKSRLTPNSWLIFIPALLFAGINSLNAQKNCKLKGVTYRDIKEIPSLENYKEISGSMLDKDYSYSEFSNKNKYLIFLEKIHVTDNKARYEILDTIQIVIKDSKLCIAAQCTDSTSQYGIVAIMQNGKNPDVNYKIIQAWQLNTTSETIEPIKDIKATTLCDTQAQLEAVAE